MIEYILKNVNFNKREDSGQNVVILFFILIYSIIYVLPYYIFDEISMDLYYYIKEKQRNNNFKHYISLILLALILFDLFILFVMSVAKILNKFEVKWFIINPLQYGILSTATYILIILGTSYKYLEKHN